MKKTKNERGVATLFVLIAGLFFISFIIGILFLSSAKRQTQLDLGDKTQDIYNQSNGENAVSMKNIVPIYTKEQLLKMGSGEEIAIEQENNRKYIFSENAEYMLSNNIELDYNGILDLTKYNFDKRQNVVKIKNTSKTEEIYYYYKNNYNYPVTKDGLKYDGLSVQYDGIDNIAEGHSYTIKTWKDLTGNKNDGTLNGFDYTSTSGWNDNSLNFDGTNDYITIQKNPIYTTEEYTMHFVIETNKSSGQTLFCNRATMGQGRSAFVLSNKIRIDNGPTSSEWNTDYNVAVNTLTDICIVRDKVAVKLYINGELVKYNTTIGDKTSVHGNISTIGVSQVQANSTSAISSLANYFSGKMYFVNIYDKALTDKEVENNYEAMEIKKSRQQGMVPIYTGEQLLKIGTGTSEVIDGKKYTFFEKAKYYIKNDITMDYNGILKVGANKDKFINAFDINFNNKVIKVNDVNKAEKTYYYCKNGYNYPVTKDGLKYDGLILQYDGIDNTTNGHSNTIKTWKDLSGNKNDGTLNGFDNTSASGWNDNSLNFDGTNDYITIQKNPIYTPGAYTIHFILETNKVKTQGLFCNRAVMGNGRVIFIVGNNIRVDNGNKVQWSTEYNVDVNTTVDICIVRTTSSVKLYINGKLAKETTDGGDKTSVHENISTIGASQVQANSTSAISDLGNYFSGKMYFVNIYDKELNAKEIENNYEVLKVKKDE